MAIIIWQLACIMGMVAAFGAAGVSYLRDILAELRKLSQR